MKNRKPISKEELFNGVHGRTIKQAYTLLSLIESQVAFLIARSHQENMLYVATSSPRAYLAAIAHSGEMAAHPTIQNIEHHASHWAVLIPEDANIKAIVAHLIGEKYQFSSDAISGIRSNLGLDMENVQQAYLEIYSEPLHTIYSPAIKTGERLRWIWSRFSGWLESLPPFWLAFGLTLPIGPGLLALPIAVADIGPIAGIILLVFFGIINMLTVAALGEAMSRSGSIRFGLGFLGQLVDDYLGRTGSLILSLVLAADLFLVLIAFYLGISGTLADTTHLGMPIWVLLIFIIGIYFLSRKSLNTTMASTLLIGAINTLLVVIIPLLAIPQVRLENLQYGNVPFIAGQPFNPAILGLVFGVIIAAYFSHLMVSNYARVIIRRDESSRSLIWGSMAAIAFTVTVSCLWVLVVNGSVAPQKLAGEVGTALAPLAIIVGPWINLLGTIFVVLSLGIASIHVSLGLFFLTQERISAIERIWKPGKQGRFLLSVTPVIIVFLLSEWMVVTGKGSFTGLLSFLGIIALPLLAGVFPVLLLIASRRKGEIVPTFVLRFLGNPWVMGFIYLLFIVSIFLHGLVIWKNPVEQAGAVLVGILMLVASINMVRHGALIPRLVIEVREDQRQGKRPLFSVISGGQPIPCRVRLGVNGKEKVLNTGSSEAIDFSRLNSVVFQLAETKAREMKIWVHRVNPDGDSEPLQAKAIIYFDKEENTIDLAASDGQAVLPLTQTVHQIKITL